MEGLNSYYSTACMKKENEVIQQVCIGEIDQYVCGKFYVLIKQSKATILK